MNLITSPLQMSQLCAAVAVESVKALSVTGNRTTAQTNLSKDGH